MARNLSADHSGSMDSARKCDGDRSGRSGIRKGLRTLGQLPPISPILWLASGGVSPARAEEPAAVRPLPLLTNVSQFRTLPIQDSLRSFSFQLTGTVTLVDTNRDLFVMQDATGAMAVNPGRKEISVRPGQ